MYRRSNHVIRFSPSVNPITGGFGKDSGGHSLITDLLQAAKSVGNGALISNDFGWRFPTNVIDTDVQAEQERVLKCSNFRKYFSDQGQNSLTLNQGTGTASYHVTTYTDDKKNARGCKSSGLSLKRRNSTLRHTSCTCRVKFTLQIDQNSFFLVCGIGENQHTGHPPLLTSSLPKPLYLPRTIPGRSLLVVRWPMWMAKDFMPPPNDDATASQSSPSENMLIYLQKSGALYLLSV